MNRIDHIENCCRITQFFFHPLQEKGMYRKTVAVVSSVALFILSLGTAHAFYYGAYALSYVYGKLKSQKISHIRDIKQRRGRRMNVSTVNFISEEYQASSREKPLSELWLEYRVVVDDFQHQYDDILEKRIWRVGEGEAAFKVLRGLLDRMEILEDVAEEKGDGYSGGCTEADSTEARFKLEKIRKKGGAIFTKVFGERSLVADKEKMMAKIGELPLPHHERDESSSTSSCNAVSIKKPNSAELIAQDDVINIRKVGAHWYTVEELLRMENMELYRIFNFIIRDLDIKISELNLFLDNRCSTGGWIKKIQHSDKALGVCETFLRTMKGYLDVLHLITTIFNQRNIVIFEGDIHALGAGHKVEKLKETVPVEIFNKVFGDGKIFQAISGFGKALRDTIRDMPAQSRPTYTYLRPDGREVKYYEPITSRAHDKSFLNLSGWTNGLYSGQSTRFDVLNNIPCSLKGFKKTEEQIQDELAAFNEKCPPDCSCRDLKDEYFDFEVRGTMFHFLQEQIKTDVRKNALWRIYDANYGAFHAPTFQEMRQKYGFPLETAIKYDWFIFFNRPVDQNEVDFRRDIIEHFGLSDRFFYIREENTEEGWEARLKETEEEAAAGEFDQRDMIKGALFAKRRENGKIPPEETFLKGEWEGKPNFDRNQRQFRTGLGAKHFVYQRKGETEWQRFLRSTRKTASDAVSMIWSGK
jgi:hypothetical protein